MAERARQLVAVLPLVLTGGACLPLEDLTSYSSAAGSTGGSSGASPASDVAAGGSAPSNTAGVAGADGEQTTGPLPLAPGNSGFDAGGAVGGTNGGAGAAPAFPDSGVAGSVSCDLTFEFASADGSSCYRLSGDLAVWSDARAACQSWGGDLVSIETMAEDLFLSSRVQGALWIGANDLDVEGVMVWPSGAPFIYANWGETQPDNFMGQENCVEKRAGGLWNDRLCSGNPLPYACER